MCGICGCSGEGVSVKAAVAGGPAHEHHHPAPAHAAAHSHAPGIEATRRVQIEADILADNDAHAQANRRWLDERGILALNLMSSPGAGKTQLLVASISALQREMPIAVIEGDQQTSHDAERIRATGVPAIQINTGKGCHLDGHGVAHAIEDLRPPEGALLFIENVGNLVCPAAFALGERQRVVLFSVTEGEDKPLKYPDMFRTADVVLISKCDLLPHLDFSIEEAEANVRRVNPDARIFRVSARSGEGLADWLDWLRQARGEVQAAARETVDALKQRIAELERQLAQR